MANITKISPEEKPSPLFFNVMPKAKLRSPFAWGFARKDAGTGHGGTLIAESDVISTKVLVSIILIVLFILALGVGGYFAYRWREARQSADASNLPSPTVITPPAVSAPPTSIPGEFIYTTPSAWQKRHFGEEVCSSVSCTDDADVDADGLINRDEHASQTDPKNNDTDSDGIGDGDETNVFATNPLTGRTAGNPKYTDADDLRGTYDSKKNGERMTLERLLEIRELVVKFNLHEPTIATLGSAIANYSGSLEESGVDVSPTAQLDRDAQRLATVRKIGTALYAFYADAGYYPVTESFEEMVVKIKPYNSVATNFTDPVNTPPYIYAYKASSDGKDFALNYYSETQKQLIKYTATNAAKDAVTEAENLNDDRRVRDLENIRSALLIYSAANSNATQASVFPRVESYKTDLVPKYLEEIPKDPKTKSDYEYLVSKMFDTFTIKARLENPPPGSTGYLCTEEECNTY